MWNIINHDLMNMKYMMMSFNPPTPTSAQHFPNQSICFLIKKIEAAGWKTNQKKWQGYCRQSSLWNYSIHYVIRNSWPEQSALSAAGKVDSKDKCDVFPCDWWLVVTSSGWSAVPMNKLEISSSRSNKQIPGLAEFVSCLFVLDAVTGREGTALVLSSY